MTDANSYPVTNRNRVKRLHERGFYDRATIWPILDAGFMAHVAWSLDGQPYCTPTIHWREGDRLFWHGSSVSRMLKTQAGGAKACLTVSHLDGIVLARAAFNHSANYRSAMCFGTARLIEDAAEKAAALSAMVQRFFPGREAMLRPITTQEMKATSVVVMEIEEASAKIRAKGVGDDADDLGLAVWAGVLPVTTVMGAPQPAPELPPGVAFPEGLAPYASGRLDAALLATQAGYELG